MKTRPRRSSANDHGAETGNRLTYLKKARRVAELLLRVAVASLGILSQVGAQTGPAAAARAAAPPTSTTGSLGDFTGYWVSVITTHEWRLRMVTPAKGDFLGFRMTPLAIKLANEWDPVKDEAAGEQCKSYGAAGIMLLPGRLHITSPDEKTLRIDLDAGNQTRLFHFGDWKPVAGAATWQGNSVAQWDATGTGGLKVTTTHMRAGYLRKNGVPYSENAVLTEYYDVVRERSGDQRLILTSVVEDPKYLAQPFTTNSQFKKQPSGSGWEPAPCSSKW